MIVVIQGVKRVFRLDIFVMCHNVFNRFYAGTLSRDVYTDWVVVFVLNVVS